MIADFQVDGEEDYNWDRAIASNFWNWLYKLRHNEPTFKALLYKCALQATRKFRCDCPVGGMNTQCSDGKQGKEEMKT